MRRAHSMSHDSRDYVPNGWDGMVQGRMGDRDQRLESTGGRASDPRSLVARLLDQLGFYTIVFGIVLLGMLLLALGLRPG